ncbi:hypothetical protein L6452_39085 [Arctium lappa]|uniref:Uncharacterized protein n=1 Tax=Arctium lappa TaxID=4217 RepID=A0ACB8XS80_ARCLA|nr:hypothetical protein L6452_39085 [Arctium lappa]
MPLPTTNKAIPPPHLLFSSIVTSPNHLIQEDGLVVCGGLEDGLGGDGGLSGGGGGRLIEASLEFGVEMEPKMVAIDEGLK